MQSENILTYDKYQSSNNCYMDGRYFNIALNDYPGLIPEPLYVHVENNNTNIFLPYNSFSNSLSTSSGMRHAT